MTAVLRAEEPSARYLVEIEPTLTRGFELLVTAPSGIGRLRDLICSLAVRGKLMPQDPVDRPAAGLLAPLRRERARLIEAGRVRKDRDADANEAMQHDFDLPRGWAAARLADVAWPQAGFAFKSSAFNAADHGLPLIRIRDVGANSPTMYFSGEFREEFIVRLGDWLIGMDGDFRVAQWSGPDALLNQRVTRLVFFGDEIEQLYVTLALQIELRKLQGTKAYTTVDHLSGSQIASRIIALPPLAEQHRIVARVEELMKLCDALEQNGRLADEQHTRLTSALFDALAASESAHALAANWQRVAEHFDILLDRPEAIDALEKTILKLAVSGLLTPQVANDEPASVLLRRLRDEQDRMVQDGQIRREKVLPKLSEEEHPFELPNGWQWARMGQLANFIDYRGRTPAKTATGVPLITAKNVRQGFINREPWEFIAEEAYAGWMTRGFPRIGDLLFTTEAPLGNVAAIDITERFALAQRVICFGLYERQMSGALCVFLRSPWMQAALAAQATGVTAQGIKSARLQLMPVPLPPLAEQHRIVARVEELRRLCTDLRQRLRQAREVQSRLADALVAESAR